MTTLTAALIGDVLILPAMILSFAEISPQTQKET